jgi:hypothetical protein
MYRVSLTTVPGLFRRTSVAAVATGLGAKPRDQWESNPPRFGEDREVAHRLLFPLNYDDLEILEDGHFPFQSELSVLFAHVEFQMVSQSKRSAPVVLQDLDPDRWRDASVDVAFRRLGDELRGES